MPVPSPGTYDVASQLSLLAVKAQTDPLVFRDAGFVQSEPGLQLVPVHVTAIAIAAAGYTDVAIQPPAGETWLIYISASQDNNGANLYTSIRNIAGVTLYGGVSIYRPSVAYGTIVGAAGWFWITNVNYVHVRCYNSGGANLGHYSYFGWRIV